MMAWAFSCQAKSRSFGHPTNRPTVSNNKSKKP
jgi:hypothetical protein